MVLQIFCQQAGQRMDRVDGGCGRLRDVAKFHHGADQRLQFKVSLDKRIAGAQAVGQHKTSMLQDVEMGRPLELQALVGSVMELGHITQTPTPTINAVHALASLLAKNLQDHKATLRIA